MRVATGGSAQALTEGVTIPPEPATEQREREEGEGPVLMLEGDGEEGGAGNTDYCSEEDAGEGDGGF